MKPAQLLPGPLALLFSVVTPPAWAQAAPVDAEPAAVAPAPPPTPAPPPAVDPPPAADLPPPPPPQSAPPPPPAGKMVISAPPLPPARDRRGQFVHDGFYLRMGVGLGGGQGSISTDRDSAPNFKAGGGGLALNLWIGGTPWRGVALGGLVSLQGMSDGDVSVEGDGTDEDAQGSLALLGVFVDAFPDPQRGLHLGGSLGLAGLSAHGDSKNLERRYGVKDYDGGGLGASGWIGYMGFVGPEWSLGGMLQLSGVVTGQKEDGVERRGSGWAANVSFTALYH